MLTSEVRELLQPSVRIAWILWIAMTVSIWLYVAVAFFVVSGEQPSTRAGSLLEQVFAGVAVLFGVASLAIPRFFYSDDRLRAHLATPVDPRSLARDPQTGGVDAERLARIETLPSSQRQILAIPGFFFMPFIVRLALNETIALFGLILAFLSKTVEPVLPFAIAATVLNLFSRPPVDSLVERGSRLTRSL